MVATSTPGRDSPSRPVWLASPSPRQASATSTRSHTNSARYHLAHGYLNAILLPYVLDFYMDETTTQMAELARACGLGREGDDDRTLAMSLVLQIRQLNERIGIPPTIEQIAEGDVPEIVRRALSEAHGTYPVPKYMTAAECATVVRQAGGLAEVAAPSYRARAHRAAPDSEQV